MSFKERVQIGWRLGSRAIAYVARDKSLLFFPLFSWLVLLGVMLAFYVAAGPDKLRIFVNTRVDNIGVEYINWGYYWVVLAAYIFVFYIAELCSVALTKCAEETMDGVDTKFRDGMYAASHRLISTAVWTLLAATVGIVLTVLDQERRCSRVIRNVLGAPWRVVTYFVVPVMVLEDVNLLRALRRSPQLLGETWGETPAPHLGLGWVGFLFAAPPFVLLVVLGYLYPGWNWLFVLLGIFLIVLTGLTLQTARTILMVVLYKYAAGQQIPSSFSQEFLEKAFLAGGSAPWSPEGLRNSEADADPAELETSSGQAELEAGDAGDDEQDAENTDGR